MSSRIKNSLRNILWGGGEKIVSILFPFLVRTAMIYSIGLEYVGLDSLFVSILQVLSFAELGVGGALIFSMYKPFAEDNIEKVGALLYLYKRLYFKIGCVIFLIGLLILPFIKIFISGEVKADVNIYVLYFMYLSNNAISYFLFSYRQSLLVASQRVDLVNIISLKSKLLMYCLQIITLVFFHNYYIYVIAIPLSTLLTNYLLYRITNKLYSHIECKGKLDNEEIKNIIKNVKAMVFQKIGAITLTASTPIIISSFLGIVVLSKFQNYYYIIVAITSLLSVINTSVIPSIANKVVSNSVLDNYSKFKICNIFYVWIVSIFSCFLLCLYQPFIKIWIGDDNLLPNDFVILLSLFFYIHHFCDILAIYQESCGIWWHTRFVPLVASIVNILLSLIFVKLYGLNAVLIVNIICLVGIWIPGYAMALFRSYFKNINRGQLLFYKNQCLMTVAAIFSSLLSYIICCHFSFESIFLQLCFNFTVCATIGNIVLIIFYMHMSNFREFCNW